MIKETSLFVVSLGAMVYFIMPDSKEPEATPVKREKVLEPEAPVDEEEWEDYDEDSEDDEDDDEYDEDEDENGDGDDEDFSSDESGESDGDDNRTSEQARIQKNKSLVRAEAPTFAKTPKGNELGSKDNPVNLTPSIGRAE